MLLSNLVGLCVDEKNDNISVVTDPDVPMFAAVETKDADVVVSDDNDDDDDDDDDDDGDDTGSGSDDGDVAGGGSDVKDGSAGVDGDSDGGGSGGGNDVDDGGCGDDSDGNVELETVGQVDCTKELALEESEIGIVGAQCLIT